MKKAPTTLPDRYCKYRFCPGPKKVPSERRRDAIYCCIDHGIWERNERQKDNTTLVTDVKELKKNRKILYYLYSSGKTVVTKSILDAFGFNFSVITASSVFDAKTNNQAFRFFDFILVINTNQDKYEIIKK